MSDISLPTGQWNRPGVREARRALECRVGHSTIVIPTEFVAQVVEYEVASPFPLARAWVAGMAVLGEHLLISVSLRPNASSKLPARRRARGAWLIPPGETAKSDVTGLVFEISATRTLVEVATVQDPVGTTTFPLPVWLREAWLTDGRRVGWLDALALIHELG